MVAPTQISTIPASSSLLCSTRVPSWPPSSRPVSQRPTLTMAAATVTAMRARFTIGSSLGSGLISIDEVPNSELVTSEQSDQP